MCASVVSCCDASAVLEPFEHALDEVSLFVEFCVVGERYLAVGSAGDAGGDFAGGEGVADPVAVVALVGDQGLGIRQAGQENLGAAIVVDLTLGQQQPHGSAVAVADRVDLGVEAASGPPDTARKSPFLSRLAAVRCAFR